MFEVCNREKERRKPPDITESTLKFILTQVDGILTFLIVGGDRRIEERRKVNMNCQELVNYFNNMNIKEILNNIEYYKMYIYDEFGKKVKFEILSKIRGDNDNLNISIPMNMLDNLEGGKSELFRERLSNVIEILKDSNEPGASINIGTKELLDNDLIEYLCENNKLSNRITLEILEEDFEGKNKEVLINIKKLKEAGYKIVIDDFGKDFSNKERVIKLLNNGTLDGVKLDGKYFGELFDKYNENPENIYFDLRYLQYLRKSGIKLTAEYVNTEEKFIFARDILKVDEFQGIGIEDIIKNYIGAENIS